MKKFLPFGLIVLMLASCSTSQDVVQDGLFQKRKYFKKGWFVDKPIKRGMEELGQDEIEVDRSKYDREPYLQPAETRLAPMKQEVEGRLPDLEFTATEASPREKVIVEAEGSAEIILGKSLHVTRNSPSGSRSLTTTPLLTQMERGVGVPFLVASLAFLIPAALLLALIILIQRLSRMDDNGSIAAMLALLMGVLALAALAML